MKTIAVIQLDRLIGNLNKLDTCELMQVLRPQVALLRQCQTIDQWVYMANVNSIARIPAQQQSELGIRILASFQSDPLDEFYLASHSPSPVQDSDLYSPVVLRIVPGLKNPDPQFIDDLVIHHRQNGFDYSRSQSMDDGIGTFVEIMSFAALDEAWREALLPDDRENITPYIYRQQQRLNIGAFH